MTYEEWTKLMDQGVDPGIPWSEAHYFHLRRITDATAQKWEAEKKAQAQEITAPVPALEEKSPLQVTLVPTIEATTLESELQATLAIVNNPKYKHPAARKAAFEFARMMAYPPEAEKAERERRAQLAREEEARIARIDARIAADPFYGVNDEEDAKLYGKGVA